MKFTEEQQDIRKAVRLGVPEELNSKPLIEICSYSFEEYVAMVRDFHGYVAPGVIIGGFMVDFAYRHLPPHGFRDAISETNKCLPDAIQILTPCSIGNSRLSIINSGRYALIFFDKRLSNQGIRVFVDAKKVELWPSIKNWYFKLVPKNKEDEHLLLKEIKDAGVGILNVQRVTLSQDIIEKKRQGPIAICPLCKEAYPVSNGPVCLACHSQFMHIESEDTCEIPRSKEAGGRK